MDFYISDSYAATEVYSDQVQAPYDPRRSTLKPNGNIADISLFSAERQQKPNKSRSALVPTGEVNLSRSPSSIETGTLTAAEARQISLSNELHASNSTPGEVERIAAQRVRLLAATYAGSKDQQELLARLEILNARLSDRYPRVTESHIDRLEQAGEKITALEIKNASRARRLGLAS